MSITLDNIKEAKENIKEVVRKTPIFYSDTFSDLTGYNVYLKCENKQKTGSFKLRGAYNKISTLTEEERSKGVIAASAGNHAQGVAYAATAFKMKSTIVMPLTAPQAKVDATKGYGAEVIQYGEVFDECDRKAGEIQKETGATYVHAFNDEAIIAGQGTIALEILEELPTVDAIVVPIGGGGLIAGIAIAAKAINPKIKVIGVQPAIIASTKASLENGKITTVAGIKSIADGVSVKTPGDITFKYIKEYVDEVVTVTEDEIALGIFTLLERGKILSEGAGACAAAALLSGKIKAPGKNVVAIVSGGNIDIAMALKIINRELILLKRRISFVVEVPDKVGELGKLINEIVCFGGNIVKVKQDQNWDEEKGIDFTDVIFEVEMQTKNESKNLLSYLEDKGYIVKST